MNSTIGIFGIGPWELILLVAILGGLLAATAVGIGLIIYFIRNSRKSAAPQHSEVPPVISNFGKVS